MFFGRNITVGAFVPGDYGALYCWANDIVAARLDGAFRPVNLQDVVSQCEAASRDPARLLLAIRLRTDAKLIGFIKIENINSVHRSAELGIRIGEERHRGCGYGKEALAIALNYCWDHLNLRRVGIAILRHNTRAINAYAAVGFKKEGLLKRLLYVNGQWVDVVLMSAFQRSKRKARTNNHRRSATAVLCPGIVPPSISG